MMAFGAGRERSSDEAGRSWAEIPSLTIEYDPAYLSLSTSLLPGQSFRWREDSSGAWVGVVQGQVWRISAAGREFRWQVYPPPGDSTAFERYFRLDVDLAAIYVEFMAQDAEIAAAIARFPGLRILAQDPTECLLSYVCTTANSITMIGRSIEEMAARYGVRIGIIDGTEYYSFPTLPALVAADTAVLARDCVLDYRAGRLQEVAAALVAKPSGWLNDLVNQPYYRAREELMTIRGVGLKIADCVCLFALNKDESVPVDTHVWQIGQAKFLPEAAGRSLTPARYRQVAEAFRQHYGHFAGWAQEYLFYAHLLDKRKRRKE